MPLYRDLVNSKPAISGKVSIVAILPDKLEEARKYLDDNKVVIRRIAPDQPLQNFGISGTSTNLRRSAL
jgi:hypothetical protein